MSDESSQPLSINTRERWKVVSSPARFDLLVHLERLGPCSIATLAEQLGRPADSLYHHVRQLQRCGVIVQDGVQRSGRNAEAVYRVAGSPIHFDFDPESGRYVAEAVQFANSLFRAAARAHERALSRGKPRLARGPTKDFHLRHESARLGLAEIERVNQLFGELVELLDSAPSDPSAGVYTLTWSMSPEPNRDKPNT